jgi:hypothetical protein
MGSSVGHQQIAKFLLSMLLSFERSETLKYFKLLPKNSKKKAQENTYCTKCSKMNFKILKFAGGSLLRSPRSAKSRQLRSVFTSIFIGFATLSPLEPAISSNSFIISGSKSGGRCFEKKSFNAVATAFTEYPISQYQRYPLRQTFGRGDRHVHDFQVLYKCLPIRPLFRCNKHTFPKTPAQVDFSQTS